MVNIGMNLVRAKLSSKLQNIQIPQKFFNIFNMNELLILPTQCIYVLHTSLTLNADYFPIPHPLTVSCNRNKACLLRGTNLIFKYNPI